MTFASRSRFVGPESFFMSVHVSSSPATTFRGAERTAAPNLSDTASNQRSGAHGLPRGFPLRIPQRRCWDTALRLREWKVPPGCRSLRSLSSTGPPTIHQCWREHRACEECSRQRDLNPEFISLPGRRVRTTELSPPTLRTARKVPPEEGDVVVRSSRRRTPASSDSTAGPRKYRSNGTRRGPVTLSSRASRPYGGAAFPRFPQRGGGRALSALPEAPPECPPST